MPEYQDQMSQKLRLQVLLWTGKLERPVRTSVEWEKGWNALRTIQLKRASSPPEEPPAKKEKYDPENPSYDNRDVLKIVDINLSADSMTALFKGQSVWYKVILDGVFQSPQALASLTRRMSLLGKLDGEKPTSFSACSGIRRTTLAGLLGVPVELITEVQKCIVPAEKSVIQQDILDLDDPESSRMDAGILQPESPSTKPIPAEPHPVEAPTPVRRLSTTASLIRKAAETSPVKRFTSPTCKPATETSPVKRFTSPVIRSVIKPMRSRSRSPNNSKAGACPSLSEEAAELLRLGCMPLMPPARREWNQTTVELQSGSHPSIVWPPKGWSHMSADQRLLQWEFAAMTLERGSKGNLPEVDRAFLLDKYNMLALPGTKPITKAEEDSSPFDKKARLYLYKTVTAISRAKVHSGESSSTIRMLRAARKERNTSTDWIVRKIARAGIKLRLDP